MFFSNFVLFTSILSSSLLLFTCKSNTDQTKNGPVGQSVNPQSVLEVELNPAGKQIPFNITHSTPAKAFTVLVTNSTWIDCYYSGPHDVTLYYDPTPNLSDGQVTTSLKDPTPDGVPPETEDAATPVVEQDTSDFVELAKISIPGVPCDGKLLKLNYDFGAEVKLTYELTDRVK